MEYINVTMSAVIVLVRHAHQPTFAIRNNGKEVECLPILEEEESGNPAIRMNRN